MSGSMDVANYYRAEADKWFEQTCALSRTLGAISADADMGLDGRKAPTEALKDIRELVLATNLLADADATNRRQP